jgi:ribosome-binding factor A
VETVTVTDVRVTENLRDATIYFTAAGTDAEKAAAHKALQHAAQYVRRQLGTALNLRYTPELHFVRDTVEEKAARVEELLSGIDVSKQEDRPEPLEAAGEERKDEG